MCTAKYVRQGLGVLMLTTREYLVAEVGVKFA